jgi:hypothetical protein
MKNQLYMFKTQINIYQFSSSILILSSSPDSWLLFLFYDTGLVGLLIDLVYEVFFTYYSTGLVGLLIVDLFLGVY